MVAVVTAFVASFLLAAVFGYLTVSRWAEESGEIDWQAEDEVTLAAEWEVFLESKAEETEAEKRLKRLERASNDIEYLQAQCANANELRERTEARLLLLSLREGEIPLWRIERWVALTSREQHEELVVLFKEFDKR